MDSLNRLQIEQMEKKCRNTNIFMVEKTALPRPKNQYVRPPASPTELVMVSDYY